MLAAPGALAQVTEQLRATVVAVMVGSSEQVETGFIAAADGYILTAARIADEAESPLRVRLADGRELAASRVGVDRRTGVALIKVDANTLPTVRVADLAELAVGDPIVALTATPDGDPEVTAGTLRALRVQAGWRGTFLETDIGNVDGPVFNSRGEVIGINLYFLRGAPDRAFAVPIDIAYAVQEQLRLHGRVIRGRLGFVVQMVTAEIAAARGLEPAAGALINSVEKRSPAERAGLRPGDVLLEIDGKPVHTARDAPTITAALKPGSIVSLKVWRDGAVRTLKATVGELIDPPRNR